MKIASMDIHLFYRKMVISELQSGVEASQGINLSGNIAETLSGVDSIAKTHKLRSKYSKGSHCQGIVKQRHTEELTA